jgi:hypothetical protein
VRAVLPFLIACGSLAHVACKNPQREFEERAKEATGADQVEVDENGDRVTLSSKSDAGESRVELGAQARIPADFPKNVPIYPGSKIVAAVEVTDKGKRSHIVTLSAPAAPDAVLQFYERKLPDFGKVEKVTLGGMRMLSADDGKGTSVNILITDGGAHTSTLQLTASRK